MYRLLTQTESLDVTKIVRIAYLDPQQSEFLTVKTHRPSSFGQWRQGEVIADMGRGIPITLVFLEDDLVGKLIVRILTELITSPGEGIINFDDILDQAEEEAARSRPPEPDWDEAIQNATPYQSVNSMIREDLGLQDTDP